MKRISMGIEDYAAVSFDNFRLHWVTGIRIMGIQNFSNILIAAVLKILYGHEIKIFWS